MYVHLFSFCVLRFVFVFVVASLSLAPSLVDISVAPYGVDVCFRRLAERKYCKKRVRNVNGPISEGERQESEMASGEAKTE